MLLVQINLGYVVLTLGLLGALGLRMIDCYEGSAATRFVLRAVYLAALTFGTCVVLGTKLGSIAHAAEQVGSGFGDLAGYSMATGPAPF